MMLREWKTKAVTSHRTPKSKPSQSGDKSPHSKKKAEPRQFDFQNPASYGARLADCFP